VASSGAAPALAAPQAPRSEVVPLTTDLRRLHLTVPKRLLEKLDAARDALSHSMPGASIEEVLEKGLDLILERQAKRRGLTDKPAKPRPCNSRHVPARVRAAVWKRDQGRCQWKGPRRVRGIRGARAIGRRPGGERAPHVHPRPSSEMRCAGRGRSRGSASLARRRLGHPAPPSLPCARSPIPPIARHPDDSQSGGTCDES
jgi:hypothetical protein